jgi:universal stress protein A
MCYIGRVLLTSLGGFGRTVNSDFGLTTQPPGGLMMFPFKKILCPTDFSDASLCGIKMGNELAQKFGAEIIIVNVHKPIPKLPTPRVESSDVAFDITAYEAEVIKDAEQNLATLSSSILSDGITPKLVVRMGTPAGEILKVAEEEEVDAICIATHGRTGLAHIVFGSVAQRVIRRARCVVVTVPMCE